MTLGQARGYTPGLIAKVFVALVAVGYLVVIYRHGESGADLNQQAIGIVLVYFILIMVPWLAGSVAYVVSRRTQGAGDITFCLVLLAECIYPFIASNAG